MSTIQAYRVPLPLQSLSRANHLFEDVWGQLIVPNHGQFKYYVLFMMTSAICLAVFNKRQI